MWNSAILPSFFKHQGFLNYGDVRYESASPSLSAFAKGRRVLGYHTVCPVAYLYICKIYALAKREL